MSEKTSEASLVSMDFKFTGTRDEENTKDKKDALTIGLVMVDQATKFVPVIPVASKEATPYLVEEVCRVVAGLGRSSSAATWHIRLRQIASAIIMSIRTRLLLCSLVFAYQGNTVARAAQHCISSMTHGTANRRPAMEAAAHGCSTRIATAS